VRVREGLSNGKILPLRPLPSDKIIFGGRYFATFIMPRAKAAAPSDFDNDESSFGSLLSGSGKLLLTP
jgi:hypothetical protein